MGYIKYIDFHPSEERYNNEFGGLRSKIEYNSRNRTNVEIINRQPQFEDLSFDSDKSDDSGIERERKRRYERILERSLLILKF